jgi:hypothetical protein
LEAVLLRIKDLPGKNKATLKLKSAHTSDGYILLEERIKGNDLFIPRDLKIPCSGKWGNLNADIDLSCLSQLQNGLDLWDCYLVSGKSRSEIEILQEPGQFENRKIAFGFLTMTFYENSRHTLSISVQKTTAANASLTGMSGNGGIYQLSGTLKGFDERELSAASLSFRRRDNKNSILYKSETNFPLSFRSDHQWSVECNKQAIFPNSEIRHEEVWDLFLRLEHSNSEEMLYLPLENKTELHDEYMKITVNPFYQAKFYVNKKRCVGLWIKEISQPQKIRNIAFDQKGGLTITFAAEGHDKIIGAKLQQSQEIWSEHFSGFSMDGKTETHLSSISIFFDVKQLKEKYKIERGDLFWIMIRLRDTETNAESWMVLRPDKDSSFTSIRMALNDDMDAIVDPVVTQPLTIKISVHVAENLHRKQSVRIAILGTCYTRGAFGSNPYFNPGYKSKYNLVYTQFHSSIPSLMSEPLPYPASHFNDRKPIEQAYISCDFEKTFFTQLSEAHGEYFLFDLYPDAVRDLVVFDDQHMITGSFYLRNRAYLQSIKDKAHFVSHDDEADFLNYWCSAADRFAEKIIQFFPQERIILQRARMTNRYYDAAHHVRYFSDQLDLVKRSNMYFQFMESYLLNLLPHIRTIDLNHYGYIGQYNHPYGQSTNHYEPAYYKKLIEKLDEIIADGLNH